MTTMTHKQFAQQAGWEVVRQSGAGFRAVRNDARTDEDVTPYCATEDEAWKAAFEMTPRKRFLVWLQNARLEAVVFDTEADLRYLLTGDTSYYSPRKDIGVSALADDMRERLMGEDAETVIVQEFEIEPDGFGFKVLSMRMEKFVGDDTDEEDE